MRQFGSLEELGREIGQVVGTSDWITITQERIDDFARATSDLQWIHVDPVRAAQGPFGTTIAHGFLTLSLLSAMGETAFALNGVRMGINYGLNRVRFPAPVPVGSRLRGHFKLIQFQAIEGGAKMTMEVTVEREGSAKPVCVAESLSERYV